MRYEIREQLKKIGAGVLSFGLAIVGAQEFGPDLVNFFNNLEQPNKGMSQAMGTDLHSATANELLAVHPNFELELCDLDAMQLNNIFINSTEGQDTPTTFISRNKATGEFETDMSYMDRFNAHVDLENDETLDLNSINSMEFRFSLPETSEVTESFNYIIRNREVNIPAGMYNTEGTCNLIIAAKGNILEVTEHRNVTVLLESPITLESKKVYTLIDADGVFLRLEEEEENSINLLSNNGSSLNLLIDPQTYPEVPARMISLFSFPPMQE